MTLLPVQWTSHALDRVRERLGDNPMSRKLIEALVQEYGTRLEKGETYKFNHNGLNFVCNRKGNCYIVITVYVRYVVSRRHEVMNERRSHKVPYRRQKLHEILDEEA